jgi:hypothetical protein
MLKTGYFASSSFTRAEMVLHQPAGQLFVATPITFPISAEKRHRCGNDFPVPL